MLTSGAAVEGRLGLATFFAKVGSQLFCLAIFLTISVARNLFRGGKPQIIYSDVVRNFRKEGLLMGQRYRRMENQKPEPGLACSQDFAERGGL